MPYVRLHKQDGTLSSIMLLNWSFRPSYPAQGISLKQRHFQGADLDTSVEINHGWILSYTNTHSMPLSLFAWPQQRVSWLLFPCSLYSNHVKAAHSYLYCTLLMTAEGSLDLTWLAVDLSEDTLISCVRGVRQKHRTYKKNKQKTKNKT